MFSSYGGVSSRYSKSTTDLIRAASDSNGVAYPPVNYNHFRKNTNPAIVNRRRRIAAPIPPQRTDSCHNVINPDLEASVQKRVKSHLTDNDDIVRVDSDAIVLPTQLAQSPTSKNFVKKLVATLERRHKEQGSIASNNELVQKKNIRNTVPCAKVEEIERNQVVATHLCENVVSRFPVAQLEDLLERDEDEDEENVDDEDWCEPTYQISEFWETDEESSSSIANSPIHIIERKSDGNNNPSKSTTVKRTIKNMFSSILNWKNAKGLPKGSREYYAARESLGEEMRAFRRDTMPRLIERATSKSKLDRKKNIEPQKRDQREFSELINNPKLSSLAEEKSIATIRPVYGSSNNNQRRSWHKQEFPADFDEKAEVVYGSIKVQPPTPPPRASTQLSPTSELYLRPSKIRELQKRVSSRQLDTYSQVELRKPSAAASSSIGDRNSIVYDVPRSNRSIKSEDTAAVLVEHRLKPVVGYINRTTPPEYANLTGIIGAHDDDKRLHCTTFTTF